MDIPVSVRRSDRRIDELRADNRERSRMSSTGASCSESCRWDIRSSPNSSALAVPTRKSMQLVRPLRKALVWREDWIRAGRCRRVIVISADDVTSDNMIGWFGAGFLASGAAATDEVVEEAAIPFDRRRHGLIMGMGAAALVVESAEAARERGIQPICEVLSAVTANSAFHGTRLDVQHIGQVMEDLVAQAESCGGIRRQQMAPQMVFVSHETYTPARGGSASAEVHALRHVFGDAADQIVIANTKGLTGHAMATGIEDVLAVKALETGLVPPVANFKEVDPELGLLNLSKGGAYPVAIRAAPGRGIRLADQHDAVALGADEGRCSSAPRTRWAMPIASPTRRSGTRWLSRIAGHAEAGAGSGQAHTARARSRAASAGRAQLCSRVTARLRASHAAHREVAQPASGCSVAKTAVRRSRWLLRRLQRRQSHKADSQGEFKPPLRRQSQLAIAKVHGHVIR